MEEKAKIQMRIKIGTEEFPLTVPYEEQSDIRTTEKNLAALYTQWRGKFPKKSESELLAMLAYQYASHYLKLLRSYEEAKSKLTQLNLRLDDLLQQQG